MSHLLLSLIFVFCGFGPSTRPASAPATTNATTNPADRIWKINSYLHGKPSEIREQINGEFERLVQLRATRQAAVKEATDELRKSVRTAKLEGARSELKEAQDALKETEVAVARAYLWRRRLVDGTRNEFLLRWPLKPGASGLLGVVTPVSIDREEPSIVIQFSALEALRSEDEHEGIRRQKMRVHDVIVVVSGVNVAQMKVGVPTTLDQNFVVVSRETDRRLGPVYRVKPQSDDVDELMKAINDLRDPISPKEMAQLVRTSVPKKVDANRWTSIDRILAATQPVRDQDPESADFKRMESWLDKTLPGDRLALRADVLKVLPGDDGNYELHATVDAGDGLVHFITGTLLPGAQERGKREEGEKDVRITGTIIDAHLSQENTLILELIDADFGG